MKKILFIDRDGTIIKEPKDNLQVDSLEKLEFQPGAISVLQKISEELDYLLVMVTNQDGLGTKSFPEDSFWPAHHKMLGILKGEGVVFHEILIDRSFESENSPNRKPNTGMLEHYSNEKYDLKNSYVIGDRASDVQLASNLGTKAIFFGKDDSIETVSVAQSWKEVYQLLRFADRIATVHRTSNETDVLVEINLDGNGVAQISTGIGFFDHMLEQLGKHSGINLKVQVEGDLQVDEHHTIEDTALALGEAWKMALGDKKGINRYGFLLPMDDCLAQVAVDFGGRPWLVWDASFKHQKVGDMPTEMCFHFFKSFSDAAMCNLNIKAEGDNDHHKIEAIFKAIAKSLKMAIKQNENEMNQLPTTKGRL
jgi:imidazoleglycerol-phosphate dehydratase/histidinol-phosphatase